MSDKNPLCPKFLEIVWKWFLGDDMDKVLTMWIGFACKVWEVTIYLLLKEKKGVYQDCSLLENGYGNY